MSFKESAVGALIIFLILTICASESPAQSTTRLKGYVYDADGGSPIFRAEVVIGKTSSRTLTDEFGQFSFDNIPPGSYTVGVTAAGYTPQALENVDILADITRRVEVALEKKVYPVRGITVRDWLPTPGGDRVITIDKQQIRETRPRDVSEILQNVEGLHVERTGAAGGPAHIRIRGSAPKHVLVLVDGRKISPSGSGVADVNTIPVEMVERIEIHKGGASAQFGPDALGGVINIITQQRFLSEPTSLGGEKSWGPWKTQSNSVTAANPVRFGRLSTKFAFSSKASQGDFDYTYRVAPGNREYRDTRVNNRTRVTDCFASGLLALSASVSARYSAQIYSSKNGLPGRASDQNIHAYRQDRRTLVNLALEHTLPSNLSAAWQLGYSRFQQYFCDREAALLQRFETRFIDDLFDVRLDIERSLWRQNQLEWGLAFQRNQFNHTDYLHESFSMGRTVRQTWSAFLRNGQTLDVSASALFDEAVVDVALRYDKSATVPESSETVFPWQSPRSSNIVERWSPKIGATLYRKGPAQLMLRGSYGGSFRLPSLNALFWKGDVRARGNPDLRPERSEHAEGGVEISRQGDWYAVAGGATFYHNRVTDLVVWTQGYQGVWSPVNLGSARVAGHEDFVAVRLFNGFLDISYQNSITNALNKVPGHNSYDKRLTHTPSYVTNVTARLNWRFLLASYAVRWVDKRYALEGNEKWYDGYRIDDIAVGGRITLPGNLRLRVDWRSYNARDVDYVLVTHYPMPGREYSIGVKVSYGMDEKGG